MRKKTTSATPKPVKRVRRIPVQVRFASHIVSELDRIAAERGGTRSSLIQDAVADWLERRGAQFVERS